MDWSGQAPFWAVTGIVAGLLALALLVLGWRTARGRRRRFVDETRAYLKGVHYLLSDNPDAAIEELTRVVKVNTETIETYFALGGLFRRKGDIERAIRIHQNILLRPGLPEVARVEARFQLAVDYRKAGMLRQARETFEQVVEPPPKDKGRLAEALTQLRDVRIEAGAWAEAADAQKRLMKIRGEGQAHVLAHVLTGVARERLGAGEDDEARDVLKEALRTDPGCIEAHLVAGEMAVRQEKWKTALEHFDTALGSRPEAVLMAYSGLSDLYWRRGKYEDLGDYLRSWVNRRPDVPQLRLALARYLRKRGLNEMAVEELRVALGIDPRFHDARQELGRILLEEDMGGELRRQFEELLDAIAAEPAFRCERCGHLYSELVWRCPRCGAWDTLVRTPTEEGARLAPPDPAA